MKKMSKRGIANLILVGVTIITLSMTIAYSALTTSLTISGEAVFELAKAPDIVISDLACTSTSEQLGIINYNNYNNYNALSLSLGLELPDLTSNVTCTATITNNRVNMIKLTNISNNSYSNDDIKYNISGLYLKDIINKGSSRQLSLTFSYKNSVEVLPANITLETTLSLNFSNIANDGIVQDGLTFYISGEDQKNSAGMWPERINGTNVALMGDVTREASTNSYYFSGTNTCGYTNASLIPVDSSTGTSEYGNAKNFTLEVRIKAQDFLTNRAIISQKRLRDIDTTNEIGRFKPMDIYNNGVRYFWQYSSSKQSLNSYYQQNLIADSIIHLTIVNDNGLITRYVNGLPVDAEAFTTPVISKFTTQIGCFSTYDTTVGISTSQNYKGYINTIRIYNNVLNSQQIKSNYDIDTLKYGDSNVHVETDLKTLAIATGIADDGSGLYVDSNYEQVNNENRYVYRGISPNNYIILGQNHYDNQGNLIEAEQIWRIMSFENDGTMKLLKPTLYPTAFDLAGNRYLTPKTVNDTGYSPYCVDSEIPVTAGGTDYKGCNAFGIADSFGMGPIGSNLYTMTNGQPAVSNNSTIANKLNNLGEGTIYTSDEISVINASQNSSWNIGLSSYSDSITLAETLNEIEKYKWTGKVGTVSTYDVRISNYTDTTSIVEFLTSSYIGNLSTSTDVDIWTMNGDYNIDILNTYDAFTFGTYIYDQNKKILKPRRASRENYDTINFYTIPVIRINSDIDVGGSGTSINPFRIINE